MPAAATPASVLAGRADELTLLGGLLKDLIRGRGAAVLVEGEPGIGKTALVRAATGARPAGSVQVFWGTGDELGQELPLLPFLDALRVRRTSGSSRRAAIAGLLRGEVPAGRGPDVPSMLAEQLIALCLDEADTRPAVVVIDDLQWADPDTVKLWGRLARATAQAPLLLIGMTRPVPLRDDLVALRRALDGGPRVQLTALPRPAVAGLVGTLAGGRPDAALLRLAAGAAGNPLYITELLAALRRSGGIALTQDGGARLTTAAVPGSLPGAITDRLDFLSGAARQVLRTAALLGVECTLSDLAAVLGETEAGVAPVLDEARAAGVLTDGSGGLAFRHPLIREALYQEMPAGVRAARHRDAGQALAAAGAPPDRVARQLLHAVSRPGAPGPVDDWLLDWLDGTADFLVAQVPQVAAELLARAVPGTQPGSARHGRLLSRLATARYRTGDRPAARQAAEQALATAADPDTAVDAHWVIVQCQMYDDPAEEALATLERALAAPGTSARHRGRLLVLAARTCLSDGQVAAGLRRAGQALATARDAGDNWAAAWALHVLALGTMMQGRLPDSLPFYRQALAVAASDPTLDDLALLLRVNLAATLGDLGREEEALAAAEQALRRAEQVGSAQRYAQASSVLDQLLFEVGRWDEALAAAAAAPTDTKEPGAECTDLGISAMIAVHRGNLAEGRRLLAAAEPAARRTGHVHVGPLLLARALALEAAGAPGEALAILAEPFRGDAEDPAQFDELLLDAVRLAVQAGDKDLAQMLADRAAALAAGQGPRPARALYCQGMAGQDAGALTAAAQLYAGRGRPLPRAQSLEAAARILAEGGNLAQARPLLDQALEAYEFLGAAADLRRVTAEFRALGIRRGPHSRHRLVDSGWESLTPTELRVAELVEQGLTNPDIAARLGMGRRTVATHVSHILTKLDVASRTDIARESALRRHGPLRAASGHQGTLARH